MLRYACGYVARSLLKQYEKTTTGDVAQQYITCLGEMAVEGEGDCLLAYTRKWLDLVNRGGLFPLCDKAFHFFVEVELCVRTYLPQHMVKTHSDKDTIVENLHHKILHDEDVQFHWDIEKPEDAELNCGLLQVSLHVNK